MRTQLVEICIRAPIATFCHHEQKALRIKLSDGEPFIGDGVFHLFPGNVRQIERFTYVCSVSFMDKGHGAYREISQLA